MTKSPPLVALVCDTRDFDERPWHGVSSFYIRAVCEGARATPVLLPAIGSANFDDETLKGFDGFLFTGSRSNVHPELYGVSPSVDYEPYDQARDSTTIGLMKRVADLAIPLFAICRGMQEMNVAFGGTLKTEIQRKQGISDHRMRPLPTHDEQYGLVHDVQCAPDARLGALVGSSCFAVNSLHRQAVDRLGQGLVVEARADDGTIEALSLSSAESFAFGVQWHPEYWVGKDKVSDRLLQAFGEACTAYRLSRYSS